MCNSLSCPLDSLYCPLGMHFFWTGTAITCKRTSHAKQSLRTTDDDCYSQRHSAHETINRR